MHMVKIALTKLAEIGLRVACVTYDGTATNMNMFQRLGCKFDAATYSDMKTTFKHPTIDYNICAIFDPRHMLKLARNPLADLSYLVDSDGEKLSGCSSKSYITCKKERGLS